MPSALPKEGWQRREIYDRLEFSELGKELEAGLRALAYPRKDAFAAVLGLREAVLNALQHGNRGNTNRSVVISWHLGAAEVLMEVADEGRGFDPYLVPNPFAHDRFASQPPGRGLFLMRVYLSWVRFNQRGNRVILCKRRSAD